MARKRRKIIKLGRRKKKFYPCPKCLQPLTMVEKDGKTITVKCSCCRLSREYDTKEVPSSFERVDFYQRFFDEFSNFS